LVLEVIDAPAMFFGKLRIILSLAERDEVSVEFLGGGGDPRELLLTEDDITWSLVFPCVEGSKSNGCLECVANLSTNKGLGSA
jgi:hypothetical protein